MPRHKRRMMAETMVILALFIGSFLRDQDWLWLYRKTVIRLMSVPLLSELPIFQNNGRGAGTAKITLGASVIASLVTSPALGPANSLVSDRGRSKTHYDGPSLEGTIQDAIVAGASLASTTEDYRAKYLIIPITPCQTWQSALPSSMLVA